MPVRVGESDKVYRRDAGLEQRDVVVVDRLRRLRDEDVEAQRTGPTEEFFGEARGVLTA